MVQAPPPFNTSDIAKCERFKNSLARAGFEVQDVDYSSEDGLKRFDSNIDANESVFEGRAGKRAATCAIYGNNAVVERALVNFGKHGGAWATAFRIALNKREVAGTDIPVNLASCNPRSDERISYIPLDDMPQSCVIENVHSHNMRDRNAAFHIHVRCKDKTDDDFNKTLSWLEKLMDKTATVSNEMCTGEKKRTRTKIESSGKSKQTKMLMF